MAVSASQAATVLQPDFNYNGYWVYVWNGGDNGNWSENNWGVLKNSSQSSLQSGDGYKPINQDPGFIGYDFSVEGGKTDVHQQPDSYYRYSRKRSEKLCIRYLFGRLCHP